MRITWLLFSAALASASPLTIAFEGAPCQGWAGSLNTGFSGGDGSPFVTASAIASFGLGGLPQPPMSCNVSVTAELQTLGPVRNGFMGVTLSGGADGNSGVYGDGFFLNSQWVGECTSMGCRTIAPIPFVLGQPFEIQVTASGNLTSPTRGGGAYLQVAIHVYEMVPTHDVGIFFMDSDPLPTVSATPVAPVPEPGTLSMLAAALLPIGWMLSWRSFQNPLDHQ